MRTNKILHRLRNPHGLTNEARKEIALAAADEIERWKDAYENICQFARENGLDTATYNR